MCIVLIIAMKTRGAPRMVNMFSDKCICLKFLPAVHFEHKPAHMNGDCCQPSVRLIKLFLCYKDRFILFSLFCTTHFTFLIKELFTAGKTFCGSTLLSVQRILFSFFFLLFLLVHFYLKTISQFHFLSAIVKIPLIYFIIIL